MERAIFRFGIVKIVRKINGIVLCGTIRWKVGVWRSRVLYEKNVGSRSRIYIRQSWINWLIIVTKIR
jgi:hypothetical protein